MNRLRVLVLAPDCNPESVTTPQIAYALAEALARLHAVTLVVRAAKKHQSVERAGPSRKSTRFVSLGSTSFIGGLSGVFSSMIMAGRV